jgi:AraC family transcriptional regulator of adaptative response / DNA-3-methyladenine glycosylase II
LPVTQVALEAGFGSVRRFNDTFRKAYRMAPSQLRRRARQAANETLTLRLAYRPPYEFGSLLDFLRVRALAGVEVVDQQSYARAFGPAEAPGWLRLSTWPGDENALMLQLHCMRSAQILKVVTRVRRMFDLDADPQVIGATLARDPRLRPLIERRPGLRLPGGWDGFEVAVRAVLARQLHAGEGELAARLVRQYGQALATPMGVGLTRLFPTAQSLAEAEPGALASLGIGAASAATLAAVACAWRDGRIDCRPEHTLDEFVARWTGLPGLDTRTAHYVAMRAFGHPDALPVDEPLRFALNGNGAAQASFDTLVAGAERWRPWRAYAVMQLWLDAGGTRGDSCPSPRRAGEAAYESKRRAT